MLLCCTGRTHEMSRVAPARPVWRHLAGPFLEGGDDEDEQSANHRDATGNEPIEPILHRALHT